MPVDLPEKAESYDWTKNLVNRSLKSLSVSQVRWVLTQMGSVMSLRKIHRKIAVMAAVMYEMNIGEELLASDIMTRANKYVQAACTLNSTMVASLMHHLVSWGYIEVVQPRKWNTKLYKRIK